MPTGYTHALEEMNYDVKKWMKESVARAFGVCITMRDDGQLTEEQIRQEIAKGFDLSYHEKKIEEAKAELKKLQDPNYDFQGELDRYKREAQERYEERLKEHNAKKEAHVKAMGTIDLLTSKTNGRSGLVVNAVKFAKEQLKTAFDFDYGHGVYRDGILDLDVEEYKTQMLEGAERDITYHTEKLAKQKKANEERLEMYNEYTKFINENL